MNLIIQSIENSKAKLLDVIQSNKPSKFQNDAENFLPIGPNIESNKIIWGYVYRSIIEQCFATKCDINNFDEWVDKVLISLKRERKTRDIIDIIKKIYLNEASLKNITPLAYLLFEKEQNSSRKTNSLIKQLQSMIGFTPVCAGRELKYSKTNFLEKTVIDKFHEHCVSFENQEPKTPYLPFLAVLFTKDLQTLSSNIDWFLQDFEEILQLYCFLYLTQLALHLNKRLLDEPIDSCPLYFILETEVASKDRYKSIVYGYNSLFSQQNGAFYKMFPYLSYLTLLTNAFPTDPPPFWRLVKDAESSGYLELITEKAYELNSLINELFEIQPQYGNKKVSLDSELRDGLTLQFDTFKKNSKKSDRFGPNTKVVKTLKEFYCAGFYKNRGAASNFLELNSNLILLLTNLVIGSSEKMLIDDVVDGFKARGIWLDIQSKKALVNFYENIGNVERLSDSGDAVYVKSTI